MKILHIATGFQVSYPGGVTNYVRTLAKCQARLGHQVHILARPEPMLPSDMAGITLHPYTPLDVVAFSLRSRNTDRAEGFITDLIAREKFDMIHFHMSLDLSLGLLEHFSALHIPYVVTLHDYYYICPRIQMVDASSRVCHEIRMDKCNWCIGRLDQIDILRRTAHKLKLMLPRIPSTAAQERMAPLSKFLTNADMLFAVSRRSAEIYKDAVPGARIVVEQIGSESISGAVDKTPSANIRAVALGTLSKHKGGDVLALLLSKVHRRDMEFHFYGRAFEGYEQKLSRLGLICHGPYTPPDIPAIMSKSDVGVVLSIWEEIGPLVAMEFINHKVPVLGTHRGGIPDIVSSNAGYLFDPDRPGDVEGAVHWLQEITIDQIRAISAGIRKLKSPQEHAQRVVALYEEVLSARLVSAGDK